MICAVEWKRLFSALKIFKILIFFSQVGLKSDVWKTASFYPPVFVDFSIALEDI